MTGSINGTYMSGKLAPHKGKLTQGMKLAALAHQIEQLRESVVSRQGKSYFLYADNTTYFFQSFAKGSAWLQRWIADGRQPPLADLRVRS